VTSATTTDAEQGDLRAVRPPRPFVSINEALGGHRNALGLLRLVLAALVIFDHAFPLGGYGADPVRALTHGQATLGSIAVGGFFAISGYLIAKSGMSADVLQYIWRRFLRIFPAYWAILILTAGVIAPVFWMLEGNGIGDYFRRVAGGPLTYLLANWTLTIGTYGIYDIFADTTPYGREVGSSVFNGSLWTLGYEWACYLLIGLLVATGVLLRARLVVPIITGLLVIAQVLNFADPSIVGGIIPLLADGYKINLTMTFMFGACIAVYAKSIPYADGLGILSAIVFLVTLRAGGFDLLGIAAGSYLVLYLAARLPTWTHRVGARNDYSYGVYIYGFLVQQMLAFFGVHEWGYVPYVLIALVVTGGFAWLSWHGIEKHALALKSWGPGRGLRHWWERATARFGRATPETEPKGGNR
jgi:peptidoglycan/LPS O-acetylase OafA/YrhL